jgi:hypothetical protein
MKPNPNSDAGNPREHDQPSHYPLSDLVQFCVRGTGAPYFENVCYPDHVAELCMLLHDDIDDFLWRNDTKKHPVAAIREALDGLSGKVARDNDLEAAATLFAVATQAAFEVMGLYLRHRQLFDQIAPSRKLLPMLASIHPQTEAVMRQMLADSHLGSGTDDGNRVGSKPWFASDTPANVYARAIIASIEMNRGLDEMTKQLEMWASFDLKHGTRTRVLPFPDFVKDLHRIPVPLSPECVMDYWNMGKQIIYEDLPEFIDLPEWESYHRRHYAGGAKPGVIRSAIYRDILTALRTMAGVTPDIHGP